MAKYLLLESRDPFESNEVQRDYELATHLARAGDEVTLFLVQNGVLAARETASDNPLRPVIDAGVKVLSDEFALRERGIAVTTLVKGVRASGLEVVVDQLADSHKALWL